MICTLACVRTTGAASIPTGGQSAAVTAKECILTMTADRASELELANDQ
jgi:hypothetical protein